MTEPTEVRADGLLDVANLVVEFPARNGQVVQAVSDVSFTVGRQETVGLVGESGCGKSTIARAVMGLIEPRSGSVALEGTELVGLSRSELARARAAMQMVFQDPLSSLNPRRKVSDLVSEGIRIRNLPLTKDEAAERVRSALQRVELDYDTFKDRRAHELSGGQRQRVCIARALVLEPSLLVCDEIASALDVSVQAQLLNLLADMKAEMGLSLLFIAHDLAVVEHISDRVLVMYLGKACELGRVETVFAAPAHPYTRLLLQSIPVLDPRRLAPGPEASSEMPSPLAPPSGCRFRTRCPRAQAKCTDEAPVMTTLSEGHAVACHFPHGPDEPVQR